MEVKRTQKKTLWKRLANAQAFDVRQLSKRKNKTKDSRRTFSAAQRSKAPYLHQETIQ
jgi:hypothetical protein